MLASIKRFLNCFSFGKCFWLTIESSLSSFELLLPNCSTYLENFNGAYQYYLPHQKSILKFIQPLLTCLSVLGWQNLCILFAWRHSICLTLNFRSLKRLLKADQVSSLAPRICKSVNLTQLTIAVPNLPSFKFSTSCWLLTFNQSQNSPSFRSE